MSSAGIFEGEEFLSFFFFLAAYREAQWTSGKRKREKRRFCGKFFFFEFLSFCFLEGVH